MSEEMIQMIVDDAGEKMVGAVAHARKEFSGVRTGRANSSLVEKMKVEAYGVEMTMQELASFSVPEARQLLITAHDPQNVTAIERAIQHSDLGLSPSNDGKVIRLVFPPLTEERRRDLVRVVNNMAEEAKNRVRGVRRAARKDLDDVEADGGVSQDDVRAAEEVLDKLTHTHEAAIEAARDAKETELLEV
ncbi:MAG: ribosome recycling factor [Acidimicrobiia bacterium]|nr:ribosome recycling factor [Acidimicrobiia bacterium]